MLDHLPLQPPEEWDRFNAMLKTDNREIFAVIEQVHPSRFHGRAADAPDLTIWTNGSQRRDNRRRVLICRGIARHHKYGRRVKRLSIHQKRHSPIFHPNYARSLALDAIHPVIKKTGLIFSRRSPCYNPSFQHAGIWYHRALRGILVIEELCRSSDYSLKLIQ